MIYGDIISYTWTIEGIGEVGNEKELFLNITEGSYVLILQVEDENGAAAEKRMNFEVIEKFTPAEVDENEPNYLLISILYAGAVLILILMILLLIMRRKGDRYHKNNSKGRRPSNGREESLWNIIDEGEEPEFADAFENILYNEDGFRSSVGGIRNRIKTDHLNERLDEGEYDELIGILDDIEG